MDRNGTFRLQDADLIAYSHGCYRTLGEIAGTFGFSVKKKKSGTGRKRVRPVRKGKDG